MLFSEKFVLKLNPKASAATLLCWLFFMLYSVSPVVAQSNNWQGLVLVTGSNNLSNPEKAAATMLAEEIGKRTGMKIAITKVLPASGNIILLQTVGSANKQETLFAASMALPEKPEAFRIGLQKQRNRNLLVVEGYDGRGVLFGAGYILRTITYKKSGIAFENNICMATAPAKYLRGHQLGYRNTANSYDAWTVAQYEQYIRELVIFGTNSIESIPIFEEEKSPHFKLRPDEMNAAISNICNRYGIEYWIWVPAQFNITDTAKRNHYLKRIEIICKTSARLDGIFFPGGDPGDNPPETVWPLLKDIAAITKIYHPAAKVWLSLQGYTPVQNQTVYRYLQEQQPSWLGGLVTGPSSPPAEESKAAMPAGYKLRYYPDLTHNVRCQFPVSWWDPAFNFTLGREAVNPRTKQYAAIYRMLEPYMDGFISYSDGVHDDVNKITWTRLGWDPKTSERTILEEYANFFFNSQVKETAADGLLSLESNWQGPAAINGGIQSTFTHWSKLEKENPSLANNWRWQMNLLRANYDAFVRKRSLYESALEDSVNAVLMNVLIAGPEKTMQQAQQILNRATTAPVETALHKRIIDLAAALWHSIGLQTSVPIYKASGSERGAVLDFLDRPLNNRWWLEDRFKEIAKQPIADQVQALLTIGHWENPGPGSFYDDAGNIAKSPHILKGESVVTDPLELRAEGPGYDWWENGYSRQRLSWMSNQRWPIGIFYNGLDTTASYTVRITGYGDCFLKINGQLVDHTLYGKGIGEIKEFPIPANLLKKGTVELSFNDINEENINWRKQSRVTEVWLIKSPN